jgi:aspartate-semialdehyde dehydrogenase
MSASSSSSFSAAVLGGTGNVGSLVVKNLIKDNRVSRVTLFTRRHISEYEGQAKVK